MWPDLISQRRPLNIDMATCRFRYIAGVTVVHRSARVRSEHAHTPDTLIIAESRVRSHCCQEGATVSFSESQVSYFRVIRPHGADTRTGPTITTTLILEATSVTRTTGQQGDAHIPAMSTDLANFDQHQLRTAGWNATIGVLRSGVAGRSVKLRISYSSRVIKSHVIKPHVS